MADNEPKGFSAPEMRFITAFFTNMTSKPDVDWDQVAVAASLKDARCARDRFRQIMAKHGCHATTTGASPRKAKKSTEEAEGSAPTKITKRAPRKKAVKKDGEDEEVKGDGSEGAEGGAPAKAKRAPRKKAVKKVEKEDESGEKEVNVKSEVKGEDSGQA